MWFVETIMRQSHISAQSEAFNSTDHHNILPFRLLDAYSLHDPVFPQISKPRPSRCWRRHELHEHFPLQKFIHLLFYLGQGGCFILQDFHKLISSLFLSCIFILRCLLAFLLSFSWAVLITVVCWRTGISRRRSSPPCVLFSSGFFYSYLIIVGL